MIAGIKNNIDSKFYKCLLIFFIFSSLSILYLAVSLKLPYNSDNAVILLEAKSFLDGNFLLKGWYLSTVSFYTTELPLFIIGVLLFGFSEKVIYLVTSVTYALLATIIIYISSVNHDGNISIRRVIVSTCSSMYIISLFANFSFFSPSDHVVGFILCLSSGIILRRSEQTINLPALTVWTILLSLAFSGDGLTLYTWGISTFIILIYKLLTEKNKNQYFKLTIATILSIIFSRAFTYLINQNGGFTILDFKYYFVDYANLGKNLQLFFIGLCDLFSVRFFGQPIFSFNSISSGIHLIGMFLAVIAVVWGIKNFKQISVINQILSVAIIVNLSEYLLGNVATDRTAVRYLLPALAFSITILTTYIEESHLIRLKPFYFYILFIILGISLIPPMSISRPTLPIAKLSAFLADRHLENGYGPYWVASITTAHTRGKVSINPVISSNKKTIEPFHWMSEEEWYTRKANFLIIDKSEQIFNINLDTAINTFGKPDESYQVDQYVILVWNSNITHDLMRKS